VLANGGGPPPGPGTYFIWDLETETILHEAQFSPRPGAVALDGDRLAWAEHSRNTAVVRLQTIGETAPTEVARFKQEWVRTLRLYGDHLFIHTEIQHAKFQGYYHATRVHRLDLTTGILSQVLDRTDYLLGFAIGSHYAAWAHYNFENHTYGGLYVLDLLTEEWVLENVRPEPRSAAIVRRLQGTVGDHLVLRDSREEPWALYSLRDGRLQNASHEPSVHHLFYGRERVGQAEWDYEPLVLHVQTWDMKADDHREYRIEPWDKLRGMIAMDDERVVLYTTHPSFFHNLIPGPALFYVLGVVLALGAVIARARRAADVPVSPTERTARMLD
jgi:hypothetical protein